MSPPVTVVLAFWFIFASAFNVNAPPTFRLASWVMFSPCITVVLPTFISALSNNSFMVSTSIVPDTSTVCNVVFAPEVLVKFPALTFVLVPSAIKKSFPAVTVMSPPVTVVFAFWFMFASAFNVNAPPIVISPSWVMFSPCITVVLPTFISALSSNSLVASTSIVPDTSTVCNVVFAPEVLVKSPTLTVVLVPTDIVIVSFASIEISPTESIFAFWFKLSTCKSVVNNVLIFSSTVIVPTTFMVNTPVLYIPLLLCSISVVDEDKSTLFTKLLTAPTVMSSTSSI